MPFGGPPREGAWLLGTKKHSLWRNNGYGQFTDQSNLLPPKIEYGEFGLTNDYDQDGDWDLLVNHQNDRASLLQNESQKGHFLKFKFVGTVSNRNGIGTQVTVRTADKEFFQELVGGTSYASSNEPALIFGLGEYSGTCTVEIRWPTGHTRTINNVEVDQSMILVENGSPGSFRP